MANRSRKTLSEGLFNTNLWGKAVLYGGLGNRLRIEINGTKTELPIEPVGVIVLGIDGLRQDVLYDSSEVAYNDPQGCITGSCNVQVNEFTLPGLSQILKVSSTVKLKDVTAIFPSITFASWASIFTGKLPNETGILGNEFFARDLLNYDPATQMYSWKLTIPGIENFPPGMVTLDADGGAFKPKADEFKGGTIFALKHAIPTEIFCRTLTGKLELSAPGRVLLADPVWADIGNMVKGQFKTGADVDAKCELTDYECRTVSIFNQYAKGVDRWGTASISLANLNNLPGGLLNNAKIMDEAAKNETVDFINNYYLKTNPEHKRKRFPAVFSIYLSGLDHDAHVHGMTGYVTYFKNITDIQVRDIVGTLKGEDEFDNKIFIVTADHGHTAMPWNYTETVTNPATDQTKTVVPETSCSLKLEKFDTFKGQGPELANNNLHIWELANLFTQFPSPVPGLTLKILAPNEIANLTAITGAASSTEAANIIAALNGPMAHIYIKGTSWQSDPDPQVINSVINRLYFYLKKGGSATGRTKELLNQHFPKLLSSIDEMLLRKKVQTSNGDEYVYELVTNVYEDAQGGLVVDTAPLTSTPGDVDAVNRISKMNNFNRSGDIILLMKDRTDGSENDRFTAGVACKSWHGGLNRSDSYVPLVMAYPGGNKYELNATTDTVCANDGCSGNWVLPELVRDIIKKQYQTP